MFLYFLYGYESKTNMIANQYDSLIDLYLQMLYQKMKFIQACRYGKGKELVWLVLN